MNRQRPKKARSSRVSRADGERLRPPEFRHPIENGAGDAGLCGLRRWSARPQASTENGLVSEEGVFDTGLAMIPGLLHPLSAAHFADSRNRLVAIG